MRSTSSSSTRRSRRAGRLALAGRRALRRTGGWLAAPFLLAWRASCRVRIVGDPREALAGRPCSLALRHAHQVAALFAKPAGPFAVMVSRSGDGDLIVPALRMLGVEVVRGSTRSAARDKGGRDALERLAERVRAGVPALLTVDGPRGPRGRVHRGIADLALWSGAPVVPIAAVPDRRWILAGSWDRLQIPKPFSRVTVHCGALLEPRPGEGPRALRERVAASLDALERHCDPGEAQPSEEGGPGPRGPVPPA
jgi:lysophospholipid acyltransferase (LPLAT)-like uncharacterized protein